MAKKSAAVDRLRADLIAQHESKRLACEEAKEQSAFLDQLEAAWTELQTTGDAKAVISLAKLLKLADFEGRLQRVKDRAIAFCEAIDSEPDADWRYPALSASRSMAIQHAGTMKALASILLDAMAGRKAATISRALKGLASWERVGWEAMRGELLFCDQMPTDPIRRQSLEKPVGKLETNQRQQWRKRVYELHIDQKLSWSETFTQMQGEGYTQSVRQLDNLLKEHISSLQ